MSLRLFMRIVEEVTLHSAYLRDNIDHRLFIRIVEEVILHSAYLRDNIDRTGREAISPLMKCTSVIHQLAYSTS